MKKILLLIGLLTLLGNAQACIDQKLSDKDNFVNCKKAAELGLADAQYNLGKMYRNGLGVNQNDEQALSWYLKSAKQGDASAQYILGIMHSQGEGTDQDKQQARLWAQKAANQGFSEAQYFLGTMYDSQGQDVIQDDKQAFLWYQKAAKQGHVFALFNLGNMYYAGQEVEQDFIMAQMFWRVAAAKGSKHAAMSRDVIAKDMTTAQKEKSLKLAREWIATH